jgi:hypothetical protein
VESLPRAELQLNLGISSVGSFSEKKRKSKPIDKVRGQLIMTLQLGQLCSEGTAPSY